MRSCRSFEPSRFQIVGSKTPPSRSGHSRIHLGLAISSARPARCGHGQLLSDPLPEGSWIWWKQDALALGGSRCSVRDAPDSFTSEEFQEPGPVTVGGGLPSEKTPYLLLRQRDRSNRVPAQKNRPPAPRCWRKMALPARFPTPHRWTARPGFTIDRKAKQWRVTNPSGTLRCLAFRDAKTVECAPKIGPAPRPLFPGSRSRIAGLAAHQFVLDRRVSSR